MMYDRLSGQMLLGCVLNNCSILYNDKYKLSRYDFEPVLLHKYIYGIIERLLVDGVKDITVQAIIVFLNSTEEYRGVREYMESEDWVDFVTSIKEISSNNMGSFDYYYQEVKKYSLLRKYKDNGIDISKFYDESKSEDSQKKNVNDTTIEEILNYYDKIQTGLKREFGNNVPLEEYHVGDRTSDILDMLAQAPLFECCLNSTYASTLSSGWSRGKVIFRAAESGLGKSNMAIADTALVSSPMLYDVKEKDFIPNPNYQEAGALFIHTEQDQLLECFPRFLSYVANVECYKILNSTLTKEEKNRVLKAGDILKSGNIHLINLPNFTEPSIYENVKHKVLNDGIDTFVFDYMFQNSAFAAQYTKMTGLKNLRTDEIFLRMITLLKEIAEEFNLRVMTMSQVNTNLKNSKDRILDERVIFGSSSIKTKVDSAYVVATPTKEELTEIQPMIEQSPKYYEFEPNIVMNCFKARHSQYPTGIKIYGYLNKSTGRFIDIITTDKYNAYMKVEETKVEDLNLV